MIARNEQSGGHSSGRAAMRRTRAGCFALAVLVALTGVAAGPAMAQQPGAVIPGAFGGFSSNPNAPIDIEADKLVVDDQKHVATFTGNVKAVQGDFTLRTPILEVYYEPKRDAAAGKTAAKPQPRPKPKPSGGGNPLDPQAGSQLTRLKARQKVLITSTKEQSATGDEADFDVKAQTVVLSGNVTVTQGKNVIRGDKLFIDLKTSTSRLETSKTGRVKAIFHRDAVDAGKAKARKERSRETGKPATSGWSSRTTPN